MKFIETIKLICGLILVSFAILAGLIFYLLSFDIIAEILYGDQLSSLFWHYFGINKAPSNVPIFFGLCGLAGAYLLASVKSVKTERKN
jgi:uncharacterized membrane protein YuzA (DUF378 family)